MSLTFYRAPFSTATLTELVLAELAIPHEVVTLDLKKGETKTEAYRQLNPNGRVPLIVHDGTPIFESAAITLYLGETFGTAKGLYPAPGPKRGEAMKWVVWANVSLGEAVYRWARNTQGWVAADETNAKAGEVAKKDMHDLLAILDAALDGKTFLLGSEYSIVDTHVSSFLDWLRHMKVDFSKHARLEAWGQRCNARPAYAKTMAAEH